MPLLVQLSMIVVLTVNTPRQRDSKRIMRAPRMRREPTGRRGLELITTWQAHQRAAQRASSPRATAGKRPGRHQDTGA